MKKYLILTVLVCLCCFLKANAQTGPCGDNAFWTLADSVLTISGSGAMYDFAGSGNQASGKDLPFNAASINVATPWYSQRLAINKIVIESGITAIGVHSFAGLQNVRQLVWPEGITHIGTSAFFFCENLEALNIPDSLTYIHEEVFYALRSLKRIIIPPKVTGINLQAFQECTGATVLDVSASVIFINQNAFNCCDGLTKVINRSLDPSYHVSGAAFTGVDLSKITLAVYPEVIDNYRNAPVWGSFGTIRAISSDAALQSLRVNTGTLSPAFNPDILSYHVTVPNAVTGITVTPSTRHSETTVTGAGVKTLNAGNNPFDITVTAEDGITTRTYSITVRRLSGDAALQSLAVSPGWLVPEFHPDILVYRDTVPYSVTGITVTPSTRHSEATVSGGGFRQLSDGWNEFDIRVEAEDTAITRTYRIKIYRISNNATLKSLQLSAGNPVNFHPGTLEYKVSVPYSTETVTISAEKDNPHASLPGNHTGLKQLNVGDNTFNITVTAENGHTKTYTVTVRRFSNDAALKYLVINGNSLVPPFNPDSLYAIVRNSANSIAASVIPNHSSATATGNGSHQLSVGLNEILIRVSAEDTCFSSEHAVKVYRKSNDASLSNLRVTGNDEPYEITPPFGPDIFDYSFSVPYLNETVTVTGEPNYNGRFTEFNQKTFPLAVGNNSLAFVNKSEDGDSVTYRLNVRRKKDNAFLKSLSVSPGELAPAFSPDIINYTVRLPYTVTEITVNPETDDEDAITSMGNSGIFPLPNLRDTVEIRVQAEDGTLKVYSIAVRRENPSTDADLKSLQADAGTLLPAFSPDVFEYSLTVRDCRDSITITAEPNNELVSVSGTDKQPLTVGNSVFHVIVTAEDGSENDYAVSVRRLSCDATLKSLTLNNGAIPFRFSPYIFEYNRFEVEDEVTDITIGGEANHPEAMVLDTGVYHLDYGDNVFPVTVMAENGNDEYVYTVTVHRVSNDPALKYLTIAPAELVPPFDPDIRQYTASVPYQVSSIAIDIETNYPLATCLVSNGDDFGEPGIKPLNVGPNVFGISVFAENKRYYRSYWVRIFRENFKEENQTGFGYRYRQLKLTASGGIIEIDSPATERVNIYSVTGTLLYSFDKPAGAFRISPFSFHPSSILIVKGSSGWVRKVMM